ncbi:hypothetical protein X768_22820 [Mesorhizobium sp. LSJC265A00]|nr:hypothetical protein X768_22820 [Mesorhizobium sp. LSJC265A00]
MNVVGALIDKRPETRLARQSEDVVDAVLLTPGHYLRPAVMAIAAHQDKSSGFECPEERAVDCAPESQEHFGPRSFVQPLFQLRKHFDAVSPNAGAKYPVIIPPAQRTQILDGAGGTR